MDLENERIEKNIIGACLLESNAIFQIQNLQAKYFQIEKYRLMFSAIENLTLNGIKIDYLTVYHKVKDKNISANEIAALTTNIASAINIKNWAKILIDNYLKVASINVFNLLLDKIDKGTDIADILNYNHIKIQEFSGIGIEKKTNHVSKIYEEIKKEQQEMFENESSDYYTDYNAVDKFIKIKRSDLVILAARPAMGKTSFALNLAKFYAKTGKKVGFFSLEMSNIQLVKRLIASEAEINTKSFDDVLFENDARKFLNIEKQISELPLYVDDTASMTAFELRSKIISLFIKEIEMIFIDYLQLISGSGKQQNREQDISEITRILKITAKELNIPIIALSQLNRGLENRIDKRPKLADLRESGAIEQDSDIVLFLYRPAVYGLTDENGNLYKNEFTELICQKYRNGALFTSELYFNLEFQKFTDKKEYEKMPF